MPNATFSTYATLLRMNPVSGVTWLGGTGGVDQTWQITSIGSISGVRNSSVQIVATYERTETPVFNYAVATVAQGCSANPWSNITYVSTYPTWSSAAVYVQNNKVNYSCKSYISNINQNIGNTPSSAPLSYAPFTISGGTTDYTDSYNSNSGNYAYGSSFATGAGENSGGNVASNGWVDLGASTNIEGTISDNERHRGKRLPYRRDHTWDWS